MEQIKTQDVYIPVDGEIKEGEFFMSSTGVIMKHDKSSYAEFVSRRIVDTDKKLLLHKDMVVLTKEQLIEIIGNAFDAGNYYGVDHNTTSEFAKFKAPGKIETITNLLK